MRRALLISFALLTLMPGAVAFAAGAAVQRPSSQTRSVPGELLVRFDGEAGPGARSAAQRESGVRSSRALPVPGLRLMRLRQGVSVASAVASLRRRSGVLYAQPNHYYTLSAVPNDPRLPEQWGLNNSGQAVQGRAGTADADIDAPEAWNITKGKARVAVAVTDSGVAYDHPDLKPNLWHNPGESRSGTRDQRPRRRPQRVRGRLAGVGLRRRRQRPARPREPWQPCRRHHRRARQQRRRHYRRQLAGGADGAAGRGRHRAGDRPRNRAGVRLRGAQRSPRGERQLRQLSRLAGSQGRHQEASEDAVRRCRRQRWRRRHRRQQRQQPSVPLQLLAREPRLRGGQ